MAGPKYGHFTAMGGLKLAPAIIKFLGIEGLVDVKRRSDLTVSSSPFGWVDEGGTAFIKGAPVAKHKTEKEIEELGPVGKAITGGLSRAKSISRAHKEHGTAIVNVRGRLKRMPAKAAAMMQAGKQKEAVRAVTVFV